VNFDFLRELCRGFITRQRCHGGFALIAGECFLPVLIDIFRTVSTSFQTSGHSRNPLTAPPLRKRN